MSNISYEFLEELGRGLEGIVFRGIDVKNKRKVAIKKVLKSESSQKEIANNIEINSLTITPKLYDHFDKLESDGNTYTYIIQELIKGKELGNAWKDNKNWDFIWMTTFHALKAIAEFHKNGYYHGDMHPNNFICTGEKLYIID